ncbi:MAG: MSMEG_0568 family radical SAM protein [Desulfatitalea sp.]|nr:MSMEG_0568 family radical SAM protein [Desulfatitalea sp.]
MPLQPKPFIERPSVPAGKHLLVREIIGDILSSGIRVPADVSGRESGAGPAEGRALLIGGMPVNASISSAYAIASPYCLHDGPHGWAIYKDGQFLTPVEVVPEPAFYRRQTTDGIDYRKVALLHGMDCLATTVLQTCRHWRNDEQCDFCGIELSLKSRMTLARKTPVQLAEVAGFAKAMDRVSHVVLTSGTGEPPGSEIAYLAECTAAVKNASGLPVHVQFAPPANIEDIDSLYHAGVDTVGIHLESFDAATLARVAPSKARIGLAQYYKTWERAVALFGPNQVSSFLIAGLGEPVTSLLKGSETLADMGVYPFVVPFRPIAGTRRAVTRPPAASLMHPIYEAVADILFKKGLTAAGCKAGCVRCGACSALAAYERPPAELVYHRCRTPYEFRSARAIRRDVFVLEQAMFSDTDLDEHDVDSIHIVATAGQTVVGTVRVFPANDSGHWIGGRLAVRKAYRMSSVGAGLVREAMQQVKRQGCKLFTAHIQEQNIPFFKKIGWETVGAITHHMGKPHQLMRADLNSDPEN